MLSFMPGCELQHQTEPVPRSTRVFFLLHTRHSLLLHPHPLINKDQNSLPSPARTLRLHIYKISDKQLLLRNDAISSHRTTEVDRTLCAQGCPDQVPTRAQVASEDLQRRPHTQPLRTVPVLQHSHSTDCSWGTSCVPAHDHCLLLHH